jgi:hypothetical protein
MISTQIQLKYKYRTSRRRGAGNPGADPGGGMAARTWAARIALAVLIGLAGQFVSGCGDNPEAPAGGGTAPAIETFTFFDLGRNSQFSQKIRASLTDWLGNDAIETRGILNLETNYPGFLQAHLPEVDRQNHRLNYLPRERVEHDFVKLMYRYPHKKHVPFDYIELVFAEPSRKPILFRIRLKADDAGTVDALKKKYGPPKVIDWEQENGQSLVWRKDSDVLMVSRVPDQFGVPDHHIVIYFIDNLKKMLDAEERGREQKLRDSKAAGKAAF